LFQIVYTATVLVGGVIVAYRASARRKFGAVLVTGLILTGCQSHEAKIDALQKEYDRLGVQFAKDCGAEAVAQSFKVSAPALSPKCADEDKQRKQAWDQLQAERARR
jgi:outer membrane murein-binding lipoprotein Lpp